MAEQAKKEKFVAMQTIVLTTINIPTPIKKFTSRENYIATNDGEIFSAFQVWFENWSGENLDRFNETELLAMLDDEFCDELAAGFVFETEIEAELFVISIANLVRG